MRQRRKEKKKKWQGEQWEWKDFLIKEIDAIYSHRVFHSKMFWIVLWTILYRRSWFLIHKVGTWAKFVSLHSAMGYKTPVERPACSLLTTPYLLNCDPDMALVVKPVIHSLCIFLSINPLSEQTLMLLCSQHHPRQLKIMETVINENVSWCFLYLRFFCFLAMWLRVLLLEISLSSVPY